MRTCINPRYLMIPGIDPLLLVLRTNDRPQITTSILRTQQSCGHHQRVGGSVLIVYLGLPHGSNSEQQLH
ncbi:hypothetical protein B0O80DRAFT_98970 [Mortierella sp. GBAus27b]|nr:hypothetical protein B0O80DRAFT_98970 [Mortierella sp. GBAus27b]